LVLPPLVPRRGNRVTRWLGRAALQLMGWEFVGEFPNLPKMVLIVAPHSSNWDFVVGVAVMFALGFEAHFIGKRELFRGPLGVMMRWLGGIPVDRRSPQGLVGELQETVSRHDRMILAITPEGTRKPVTEWKSGFYHIALASGLPIAPAYFDNAARRVGFFPVILPTGDAERDIAALRARYAGLLRRDQLRRAPRREAP
jgi:1-acyl-sn-glycerol-3-phosphate acyltransferase